MNKQEAIKRIEGMGEYEHFVDEPISKKGVLNIVRQIDEPQKVTIPQFVADWIEKHKEEEWWLAAAFVDRDCPEFREWLVMCDIDTRIAHQELFTRAWLDGYEVEQEKKYTVEIPNPHNTSANVLCLRKDGEKIHIAKQNYKIFKQSPRCQLTESEIKKDFEWAWQFAEEVKRVENGEEW
ncbi:DUF1642 domain-containing protein [Streptococcus sp. ZJ100]|uniref:DUF1642 domain-containing protein n=1 Tax=Streptococcus handemini TaxID=3161188 RepID=UPI0032EE94F1